MVTQAFKVFVGLDIGADFHVATILTLKNVDSYRSAKSIQFPNNLEGFLSFQEQLDRASGNPAHFKMVLEPTGGWYPAALLQYLANRGYSSCYYVNNGSVANYAAAQGIESKTDELDSRVLAHMAYAITRASTLYGMRPVPQLDCITAQIRELSRLRYTMVVSKGRHLNQLHQLTAAMFPELKQFFKMGASSVSCRRLLEAFPTPTDLAKAGVDPVRSLLVSCGATAHAKRVPELLQLASTSAGCDPSPGLRTRLLEVLRKATECTQTLAVLDHALNDIMRQHPWMPIFASFPGYSPIWAATLTSTIIDVARIPNGRAFRRALGWAPREKSSGKSRARARLGRAGSRHARRVVFQWVFTLLSSRAKPNAFRVLYHRLRAREKKPMTAIGHVCGELLSVLYACLKRSQLYDELRHYQVLKEPPPTVQSTKTSHTPRLASRDRAQLRS